MSVIAAELIISKEKGFFDNGFCLIPLASAMGSGMVVDCKNRRIRRAAKQIKFRGEDFAVSNKTLKFCDVHRGEEIF
ncbi:MAG: hypothetical protein HYZ45_12135 [Burkholderiales bacterium]|nr:hypothetical protein [Burkholderiales bacterium]